MAFVSFFPQLVAGPIQRASDLLPQFLKARTFKSDRLISGFRYILYGLFKKMVIADRLAYFVDRFYNSPDKFDGTTLLVATFMFGFQVYCDFSGYSDIATGSARLLGFDLTQNFKTPYFSNSFRDFGGDGIFRCQPGFAITFTFHLVAIRFHLADGFSTFYSRSPCQVYGMEPH